MPIFQQFLRSHTVQQLVTAHPLTKVVELNSSIEPSKGFEVLFENSILSAPVYDQDSKHYIGFLDLRDLVSSVVFNIENKTQLHSHLSWSHALGVGLAKLQSAQDAITCKYLAKRNQFIPVELTSTLYDVGSILAKGLHRVPVVNKEGKCIYIVSQSSIIEYLGRHLTDKELKEEGLQTVQDLGLAFKKVTSIDMNHLAVDAFGIMDKHRLSGIAVVDKQGRLIGNTSASDLKLFILDKGKLSLNVPILDYLANIRQRLSGVDIQHPCSSVKSDTPISRVIGKLVATHHHRTFVVDDSNHPVGVIALTDILKFATSTKL